MWRLKGGVRTGKETPTQKGAAVIALTLQQVIGIALWILAAFVVTTVFKESHFVALLYWMVVYLPLVWGVDNQPRMQ
jgi:hypothetical protein